MHEQKPHVHNKRSKTLPEKSGNTVKGEETKKKTCMRRQLRNYKSVCLPAREQRGGHGGLIGISGPPPPLPPPLRVWKPKFPSSNSAWPQRVRWLMSVFGHTNGGSWPAITAERTAMSKSAQLPFKALIQRPCPRFDALQSILYGSFDVRMFECVLRFCALTVLWSLVLIL